MVDAKKFEKSIGVANTVWNEGKQEYEKGAMILRIVDIREYSGIGRFYFDGKGNETATGLVSVPMTTRNPYRLREGVAYEWTFDKEILKKLPVNVHLSVIPNLSLLETVQFGIPDVRLLGRIKVVGFCFRRIEIVTGYPAGLLLFSEYDLEKKTKGSAEDGK